MRKKMIFISCIAVLLLSSCAPRKGIVYLQDMELGQRYLYDTRYEAAVYRNDRLGTTVNCECPELAIPFNAHGSSIHVGADGNVSTSSGEVSAESVKGYRVDVEGNIDLPILDKLHVEELKVNEVMDLIRNRIIQGNYAKGPQVSLEFLSFKYTVLGAVGRMGTFTVKDSRITLLEAIANAGDLSSKAKIDSMAVICEIDGKREILVRDLYSKELFASPCYYLQQNDIAYAKSRYRKKDSEDRGFQVRSIFLSLASAIISLIWTLKQGELKK